MLTSGNAHFQAEEHCKCCNDGMKVNNYTFAKRKKNILVNLYTGCLIYLITLQSQD